MLPHVDLYERHPLTRAVFDLATLWESEPEVLMPRHGLHIYEEWQAYELTRERLYLHAEASDSEVVDTCGHATAKWRRGPVSYTVALWGR